MTSLDLSSTGLGYIVIDIRVNRDTRTSCLCISTGSNDHHFSDPLNKKRQRPRWQDYSTCRRTEIRGVRLPLLSNHRRPYFSVTKHCSNQIIIILLFWGFISSAISYCLVFSLTDACSYFIFLSTCCCSQLNLLRIFRVVYKYIQVCLTIVAVSYVYSWPGVCTNSLQTVWYGVQLLSHPPPENDQLSGGKRKWNVHDLGLSRRTGWGSLQQYK